MEADPAFWCIFVKLSHHVNKCSMREKMKHFIFALLEFVFLFVYSF